MSIGFAKKERQREVNLPAVVFIFVNIYHNPILVTTDRKVFILLIQFILYEHTMSDGSMFADIIKFIASSNFDSHNYSCEKGWMHDKHKNKKPANLIISKVYELLNCGAGDRGRTGTVSPPRDFESRTSANSITPAAKLTIKLYHINSIVSRKILWGAAIKHRL